MRGIFKDKKHIQYLNNLKIMIRRIFKGKKPIQYRNNQIQKVKIILKSKKHQYQNRLIS